MASPSTVGAGPVEAAVQVIPAVSPPQSVRASSLPGLGSEGFF